MSRQDDFRDWFANQINPRTGENYVQDTISGYQSALSTCRKHFTNELQQCGITSIYDIDDVDTLEQVYKEIQKNSSYSNLNRHNRFSSSIEKYRTFLKELGNGDGGQASNTANANYISIPQEYNKIYYGAPGTGKSYLLNEKAKKYFKTNNAIRVTFYPDYSYANFVGTYKPVVRGGNITYEFVPGPFLIAYVKAWKNPNDLVLLVIEEINRANPASVFGDIFQLLDRKNGVSEYPIIASKDVEDYLKSLNITTVTYYNSTDDAAGAAGGSDSTIDGIANDANASENSIDSEVVNTDNEVDNIDDIDFEDNEIPFSNNLLRLPNNLYIWATMNSADQGVYPMDTAFKRRWEFEYVDVDHGERAMNVNFNNQSYDWNKIRKAINDVLVEMNVNEDKLMGAFFLKDSELNDFAVHFKYKVLMYLFEDVARQKRGMLFSKNYKRFSELCKDFVADGLDIFSGAFHNCLSKY